MGSFAALLAAAAASAAAPAFKNVTVYRVTPVNYTGLVNMDSSDALGDVMFGMNQLTLPYVCEQMPSFLWCANRQFLSGGSAHMVYSKFRLEARQPFGNYIACNPNPKTGIFECEQLFTPGAGLPAQCKVFRKDAGACAVSTVYRDVVATEGGCCEACEADPLCTGFSMPDRNGTVCQLLMGDRIEVPSDGKCITAYRETNFHHTCWYDDARFNVSFAPYCSRAECDCKVIDKMSVGMEYKPMCFHASAPAQRRAQLRAVGLPPTLLDDPQPAAALRAFEPSGPFWNCSRALYRQCSSTMGSPAECEACGGAVAECTPGAVQQLCSADEAKCAAAVDAVCGAEAKPGKAAECLACTAGHDAELLAGRCNASLVSTACEKATQPTYNWVMPMLELACLTKGTWYSTVAEGRCGREGADDCWWRADKAERTVNQTCVDQHVYDSVRAHDGSCFAGCPMPGNMSDACSLQCMFATILGQDGRDKMDPAVLEAAFERSFIETDPKKGGCPPVFP